MANMTTVDAFLEKSSRFTTDEGVCAATSESPKFMKLHSAPYRNDFGVGNVAPARRIFNVGTAAVGLTRY